MSQWYYQMLGEEFGPVSTESLRQLVEDGMLEAADLVRPADSTQWGRVDQSNLIDTDKATAEADSDVLTDLADLNFEFEESGGGPKRRRLPDTQATLSRTAPAPEAPAAPLWFHQFFGQVMGPIPLPELVQMAESGNLNETDSVRCGIEGEWQAAGDVPEIAAGFILGSGDQSRRGPLASAPQGRSLFAAAAEQAAKVKAQADAQRAKEAAAAAQAAAAQAAAAARQPVTTASEGTAPDTSPTVTPTTNSRSPAAAGATGRRMGKKAEEKLVDNILSEVFAEPAASSTPGKQVPGSTGSAATATAGGNAMVEAGAHSAPAPAQVPRPAFTPPTSMPTPMAPPRPAPSPLKSTSSKSSGGGFSVPGGSGIVVAVLVVVAVGWFSYGPINRMLTVDEAKYIQRMEESLATIEKLSSQTDQNELYKVQDEMYREFNDYIKVMHGAGATTGSSKKCLAALGRFTEVIRVDPKRNPDLRKKLLTDAKQLISDWKAK